MNTVLAIDIGGTKYSLGIVSKAGEILHYAQGATKRQEGPKWLVPRLIDTAKKLIERANVQPVAAGIGFGGPVDFPRQAILASLHAPGWPGFPLQKVIERELALPCVIDNDANTGALGEARYGAGRNFSSFLYYTVSTGVGGGVIIDGHLLRGAHSQAGELGHIPIVDDGPECTCGSRGCVESLCSGLSIARRAREKVSSAHSVLKEKLEQKGSITAKDVFAAAASGDGLAKSIVEETKEYLATGIAGAVNVLDPEAVIIGGGVSLAGDQLLEGLSAMVSERLVIPGRRHIPCLQAELKERSVLLGAAALGWDLAKSSEEVS